MNNDSYKNLISKISESGQYIQEIREPEYNGDNHTVVKTLDENIQKLISAIYPYAAPIPIKDAPTDTPIRIFGGTFIDKHWETSGTKNTYGVTGYYDKEKGIAQVQHSSYEVYNPTHFMLLPDLDGYLESKENV